MSYTEEKGWIDTKFLQRLQELSDLSDTEFAQKLNINRTSLYAIYSGMRFPTPLIMRTARRVFPPEMVQAACSEKTSEKVFSETEPIHHTEDSTPGERVRKVREKAKLYQDDLARMIHATLSDIRRIEKDEQPLTVRRAQRIADLCDVGEDYILYGLEERKEYPVNEKLFHYLWEHPEIRRELWERMKGENP